MGDRRKIILPPKKNKIDLGEAHIIPATELLLHDAKAIIGAELSKYRAMVQRGVTLDPKQARIVQGYLESLVKIQKEESEQTRSEDLSQLSNEELLKLAASVLSKQ